MINNLYESVKNLTEETLPQKLEKAAGIGAESAADIVKGLSFNEYVELANAIDTEDSVKIQNIVGSDLHEAAPVDKVTVTNKNDNNLEYKDEKGNTTTVDLRKPDADPGLNTLDQAGMTATDNNGENIAPALDDIEKGDTFGLELEEEMARLKELAGLNEGNNSPSFISSVDLVDGQTIDDVTVEYYYEPGDAATRNYPGSDAEATIERITYNGREIDLDNIANIDYLTDEALEDATQSAQDDYDARGDYEMERQRERRYEESLEVDETASAGGTSAGGIATAPAVTGETRKRNSHPGTIVGSDKYTGY